MFKQPQTKNNFETITVPCNKCIGCRLERSRQWAIRAVHEAQLHKDNVFITLTFSDENLPANKSLIKSDFQKFIKRLRKKFKGKKILYLHVGEYGEVTNRPHHHAILFGIDFPDKKYLRKSKDGHKIYTSKILESLWSVTDKKSPYYKRALGIHEIGAVTFESAAYIARYCCKKQNEKQPYMLKSKYLSDGRLKEYNSMSLKPAIAKKWLEKYQHTDVFNTDTVTIRGGAKCRPPKYYSNQYQLTNPKEFEIIQLNRKEKAKNNPDNTQERLDVRRKIKEQKFKQLKRSL